MPGRKTDVGDTEWIVSLLQHGLVRPGFIPDQTQRELRDLTRTRTTLIDERSASVQRLQKVLEGANLKLSSVATDIFGTSGRVILEAWPAGTTDPAMLAEPAKGRRCKEQEELERALAVRRGKRKAVVAIGGRILVSADHILVRQEDYHEINLSVYTERRRARLETRAVEQREAMGYEVTISKTKPAA